MQPPVSVAALQTTRKETWPDKQGHFGRFGGCYVPETLFTCLQELAAAYAEAKNDPTFRRDLDHYLRTYAGRPTELYLAEQLTEYLGG
ncbi:MAG: tryptophan synthase subunit beta, partial [Opitutales bacterium]